MKKIQPIGMGVAFVKGVKHWRGLAGAVLLLVVYDFAASAAVPYVEGYADSWSNVSGQPADFYLSGVANPETPLTIYDVSSNPRATITAPIAPQEVAATNTESWKDGYGWQPQTLDLPELPSGLYFLSGPDVNQRTVPFLITEPAKQADIVVIYPTNTLNAYMATPNFQDHPNFGERVSLYSVGEDQKNPPAVSFHRPMPDFVYESRRFDQMMLNERTESVKYISDADLEDYGSIANAKMVVIPSHSEYWTASARRNFDQFVEKGGSALVLSGNVMYRAVAYDDPSNPTQLQFSPRLQFTSPSLEYPIWESIGADFHYGGYGPEFSRAREVINNPLDGYKLLDVSPSYFDGTGLSEGDILHNPAREYDGVPFTELDPVNGPKVDRELLGFHRLDVIAFENTRLDGHDGAGTWIDFQKSPDSGRVINVGEMHWTLFLGDDGTLRKQITHNMMDTLLIAQADFDGDDVLTGTDVDLLMAEINGPQPRLRFDLTEDELVNGDDLDRWLRDFAGSLYGDANLDGTVEMSDFFALRENFRQPGGWSEGDFDGSGVVDFSDFRIFLTNLQSYSSRQNWGSQPRVVPEPTGHCLLAFALLASTLVCRSRRRLGG